MLNEFGKRGQQPYLPRTQKAIVTMIAMTVTMTMTMMVMLRMMITMMMMMMMVMMMMIIMMMVTMVIGLVTLILLRCCCLARTWMLRSRSQNVSVLERAEAWAQPSCALKQSRHPLRCPENFGAAWIFNMSPAFETHLLFDSSQPGKVRDS